MWKRSASGPARKSIQLRCQVKYFWQGFSSEDKWSSLVCLGLFLKYRSIHPAIYCIFIYQCLYLFIYLCLSISIHLYSYLSISIDLCRSLSISIHLDPSLSISIHLHLSLSISIYIYRSRSISIYLYLYLSISIYLYLSIYISIHLYLSLSISIYIYPSLSISIYLYLSIYISIHLYPSLSISIHLYPSLSVSIYLYLSLSISIYIYPSLSISIYVYLCLSISIHLYLSICREFCSCRVSTAIKCSNNSNYTAIPLTCFLWIKLRQKPYRLFFPGVIGQPQPRASAPWGKISPLALSKLLMNSRPPYLCTCFLINFKTQVWPLPIIQCQWISIFRTKFCYKTWGPGVRDES